MALNFPDNPNIGDTYQDIYFNLWSYDGIRWGGVQFNDVQELNDLEDYDDLTPTTGHYIGYNNATSSWEARLLQMEEFFLKVGMTTDLDVISAGATFKFDNIILDSKSNSNFDVTTGKFIVPYTGYYEVEMHLQFNQMASGQVNYNLRVDGIESVDLIESTAFIGNNWTKTGIQCGTKLVYLLIDSKVDFIQTGRFQLSGSQVLIDSSNSYATINLI